MCIRDSTNPVLAAYVNAPVHSGDRAMRTGIAQGGANVASYSPVEQAVVVAGLGRSEVRFWRINAVSYTHLTLPTIYSV